MKIKSAIYTVLLAGLLLPLLLNCKKEAIKVPPTVTITSVTNVTSVSANSGGEVTSDGGTTITERGVCWSVNQNPTTSDSKIANGTGLGSFTSSLTGLIPGTTYNIKAYAINSVGTGYSNQLTYKTLALVPVLTTTELSTVTATSATSGGNITNNGGAEVTARGVCWSTTENPTITDSKTTDGTGSGSFTSSITILTPGATYYFRAYATNSIGTAYGNQLNKTTTAILSVISTTAVSAITSVTAISGGNITNNGGAEVTARGVCWSTNQNPTIANSKTTDGVGSGTFPSSISGLNPGVTYYIRAYASNSIGTAYGDQITITTTASLPMINTTAASAITSTTASSGGNITSDGGAIVTTRGVCYSTSQNPTILDNKISNDAGAGSFSSLITGLLPGTNYYIRAFGTNSAGTVYGSEVTFKTLPISGGTVTDIDGNVYKTVTIGTQVWMVENLKTMKYRNGDPIPNVTGNTDWGNLTTGAFCNYNNNVSNTADYGRLYNWDAVIDNRNIAPDGWHVPNSAEWFVLIKYLGGQEIAGGKLKEAGNAHWGISPYTVATNETGFTALPGGFRTYQGSGDLGANGYWWTIDKFETRGAWFIIMYSDRSNSFWANYDKSYGMSVRCLKN